ncbi:MAG: hypothetical protein ACRC3F_07690, partial [Billgrantia desiderata]
IDCFPFVYVLLMLAPSIFPKAVRGQPLPQAISAEEKPPLGHLANFFMVACCRSVGGFRYSLMQS